MSNEKKETYLGDGLYASFDGFQYILRAPRGAFGDHVVALEDEVLKAFFRFIERVEGVTVKVEPCLEKPE